ncbi:MAG TPA: hypothetical protein VFF86_03835 [Candidatus Methylomirabilis sp.]|nr:hypothetical protein [Candidatus Methylomirabilis sp.]
MRILKVKNLTGSGIRWDEEFYVTEIFYQKAPKAHVQEDDILMLCSAHNKMYIGRCDIVKGLAENIPDGRCAAVGEIIIIRADEQKILPDYLLTYLRLPVVQAEISRMVKGQSAHLYSRDLRHLRVAVPSPEKQRVIAQFALDAQADYRQRITEATMRLDMARAQVETMIHGLEDQPVRRSK